MYAAYENVIQNRLQIESCSVAWHAAIDFGKKSDPMYCLTDEKNEPENFLISGADIGYSNSRRDVPSLVEEVLYCKELTDYC